MHLPPQQGSAAAAAAAAAASCTDTYSLGDINDRNSSVSAGAGLLALALGHQRPDVVDVHGRAEGSMLVEVVRAHTNLTKVSRVATHDRSQSQPIRQAHTKAITQITACYH